MDLVNGTIAVSGHGMIVLLNVIICMDLVVKNVTSCGNVADMEIVSVGQVGIASAIVEILLGYSVMNMILTFVLTHKNRNVTDIESKYSQKGLNEEVNQFISLPRF